MYFRIAVFSTFFTLLITDTTSEEFQALLCEQENAHLSCPNDNTVAITSIEVIKSNQSCGKNENLGQCCRLYKITEALVKRIYWPADEITVGRIFGIIKVCHQLRSTCLIPNIGNYLQQQFPNADLMSFNYKCSNGGKGGKQTYIKSPLSPSSPYLHIITAQGTKSSRAFSTTSVKTIMPNKSPKKHITPSSLTTDDFTPILRYMRTQSTQVLNIFSVQANVITLTDITSESHQKNVLQPVTDVTAESHQITGGTPLRDFTTESHQITGGTPLRDFTTESHQITGGTPLGDFTTESHQITGGTPLRDFTTESHQITGGTPLRDFTTESHQIAGGTPLRDFTTESHKTTTATSETDNTPEALQTTEGKPLTAMTTTESDHVIGGKPVTNITAESYLTKGDRPVTDIYTESHLMRYDKQRNDTTTESHLTSETDITTESHQMESGKPDIITKSHLTKEGRPVTLHVTTTSYPMEGDKLVTDHITTEGQKTTSNAPMGGITPESLQRKGSSHKNRQTIYIVGGCVAALLLAGIGGILVYHFKIKNRVSPVQQVE